MTPDSSHAAAVLVTGVSSGIGEAVAEHLLEGGYRVFGSVRRPDDAQSLTQRWPRTFTSLQFDVTDTHAIAVAAARLREALHGQGLAALVNNAGVSHAGPLEEQPMNEIREVFEVNVFGSLSVTRAMLPLLRMPHGAAQARGRIVNIGSVSGAITVPFMGAYSASKHAVEAVAQALRRELMPQGIEVTTIEPGFVRSRMFEKAAPQRAAERYAGTAYAAAWRQFNLSLLQQEQAARPPETVARAVRAAIEARRPRTRQPLDPLWRIGRLLPDRGFDRLIFKALGIASLMRPR
jgi:NAD(P)-dependent dehydrogenase (short-subunit alcohol dehydrogenase family)